MGDVKILDEAWWQVDIAEVLRYYLRNYNGNILSKIVVAYGLITYTFKMFTYLFCKNMFPLQWVY